MVAISKARDLVTGIVAGVVVEAVKRYMREKLLPPVLQQTALQTEADCRLRHKASGSDPRGSVI